jgi:hypothetical protein
MRRAYRIPFVLIALVLAGCLPNGLATPSATPTTNATPAPTVVLTVPEEASISPAVGCTVITQKPTPGPTPESIFPPVSDSDWVKGPATARVTILEYADFQ